MRGSHLTERGCRGSGVRQLEDLLARPSFGAFSPGPAQPLVDLQPQFLDHGLGDGIDRLDCCQDRPAGFAQGEQQAAFDRVRRQLTFKMVGCPRVAAGP